VCMVVCASVCVCMVVCAPACVCMVVCASVCARVFMCMDNPVLLHFFLLPHVGSWFAFI
jgi:hypothetical protein